MSRLGAVVLSLAVALLFLAVPAETAEVTLTADSELHPLSWAVGTVKFKKDTRVVTNEYGEVISGVLDKDTRLHPVAWQRVMFDYTMESGYSSVSASSANGGFSYGGGSYSYAIPGEKYVTFKGGQAVTFNSRGEVVKGTLADDACIRLLDDKEGYVRYKDGTPLAFHDSGGVASGTLAADTLLRPTGWQEILAANGGAGFVKFKKGTAISFTEGGLVTAGTLAAETKLKAAGQYMKIYPPGTAVKFNDKGELVP